MLSSLALVFALHHYKPTPCTLWMRLMQPWTLRMFPSSTTSRREQKMLSSSLFATEQHVRAADRLVGIYKTENHTKTVAINPGAFTVGSEGAS